jgi:hypothetical protein
MLKNYYTEVKALRATSGLAKWRLSPLTVRGSQSHHAGQFSETPLRQAAGSLSASRDRAVRKNEVKKKE